MMALHNMALEMAIVEESEDNPDVVFQNKAALANFRGHIWIKNKIIGAFRRPQDIEDWQDLRREVLQKPTISAAELAVSPFPWAYIALPEAADSYFYMQKNDFEIVEISFQKHLLNRVSAMEVRLHHFLQLADVADFFQSEGFTKDFKANDYILSPVVFTPDGKVDRKLNVALSRAKKHVVLTGCDAVLRQNPIFTKLLNHIQVH
jgi:hypothetical protein